MIIDRRASFLSLEGHSQKNDMHDEFVSFIGRNDVLRYRESKKPLVDNVAADGPLGESGRREKREFYHP